MFDCDFSQSGNLSLSFFSFFLRSDCTELDFKEFLILFSSNLTRTIIPREMTDEKGENNGNEDNAKTSLLLLICLLKVLDSLINLEKNHSTVSLEFKKTYKPWCLEMKWLRMELGPAQAVLPSNDRMWCKVSFFEGLSNPQMFHQPFKKIMKNINQNLSFHFVFCIAKFVSNAMNYFLGIHWSYKKFPLYL